MTPAELRAVAASLPPDTPIPVPAKFVLLLIDGDGPPIAEPLRDLTVAEVAAKLGLSPKTVVRYLQTKRLRGYPLPGRGWRVPLGALDELKRTATRPTNSRLRRR